MSTPRIALIHALRHSPRPIEAAFAALWPEPQLMNLLDDSLSVDLARDGAISPAMTRRFVELGRYAAATAIVLNSPSFAEATKTEAPEIALTKTETNRDAEELRGLFDAQSDGLCPRVVINLARAPTG